MGYSETLEAAGAKVLDYKEFGNYQGDWAALVEYKGEKGIVFGSYGSCSGCDAFQAEFDFSDEAPIEKDGKYYKTYWDDEEISKSEFDEGIANYNKRLHDFGMDYLTAPLATKDTIEKNIAALKEDDWFDDEKKEMYDWCLEKLNEE